MNTKWVMALVAAAALGLLAPAVSFATQAIQIDANVPFSFRAGDEALPAGHYVFLVDDPMHPSALVIQKDDGSRVEVMLTATESSGVTANRSKLVFDEYGNDHFLAKVLVAGFDEARVLPKSEIQREYAELLRQREVPARATAH